MAREIRNSLHNIERNTKDTAQSAASAAHHSANTARAAQSAAAGAWVGAGFQAVNVLQSARAARAAEEQLQVQRAMAEQAQQHQFAMWSQTDDGRTFLGWRDNALRLAQNLRDRQAQWLQTWARVIGQAQEDIPDEEKRRFAAYPSRLRQGGLLIAAIFAFAVSAIAGVAALIDNARIGEASPLASDSFTYEQCLEQLDGPGISLFTPAECEAMAPYAGNPAAAIVCAVALALGIALIVLRTVRRRAARNDTLVADETRTRVALYGFDPLAVQPGFQNFGWEVHGSSEQYADHITHVALTGHLSYPSAAQLTALHLPEARRRHPNYPPEINALLESYQPHS